MIGIRVTVPIACFKKGLAREYLETEPIPPPATCYGFLLSLVGETERTRHLGCRIAPVLIQPEPEERMRKTPRVSVVLRTVWRVKKMPLGSPGNTRPDYQQLLSPIELVIWVDSSEEKQGDVNLERRIAVALDPKQRHRIKRFGALSMGESSHLVDEVCSFAGDSTRLGRIFLRAERGRMTLPVWVDHVGSADTRWVTGDLTAPQPLIAPKDAQLMPRIDTDGCQT